MNKLKSEEPVALAINCFDAQYREKGMGAQRTYPNEAMIQFVASRFFGLPMNQRREVRVLEIGCGSGANLWMLAKEGFQVYGLDSSQAALSLAKKHLEEKWGVLATLQQGSFTELPYEDAYFDAVVDVVSMQHMALDSSKLALKEVARVLRPGGEFFSYRLSDRSVMFSQAKSEERIDAATLQNINDPRLPLANNGPTSFWSPALAGLMYSECDLELISAEHVGRAYVSGAYVEYLSLIGKSQNK